MIDYENDFVKKHLSGVKIMKFEDGHLFIKHETYRNKDDKQIAVAIPIDFYDPHCINNISKAVNEVCYAIGEDENG